MKKFYTLFTALFFALFSFMTYAQGPWNFNGSNDIWESTGTIANLTSGASFSTLDVNSAGNPMLRTFSANINASAVTHAVITLKNNTANKYMRVFYQTTGTNRYVNVGITANDADFVSYYVDMTGNADWTGTVNELTIQFKENSSYSTALDGTIDIDNIEMTSSDLGVNMVNNSSFENWVDDTEATPVDPVGFYKHESVERSSDSHSGDYSLKVIATSTRDLAQTVNEITAGATYRVSINYKIEANTGNGVRLWSTWKDASNVSLASSDLQPSGFLNTVSSEWATFSVDAVAPENATKLNFEVRSYGGATVYWDSFSVSKVAEPDPCDGVTGAPAIADDFDGNSVDILEYVGDNNVTYSVIDGTPTGVTSNVLEYVDGGGAGSDYANLQLRTCNKFDMAVTNFFTMDVYIVGSSLTGTQPNQVAFKLQDQSMGGNAWQSQVEVVVPVTAVDTWQTVEFDFIGSSDRIDFDQVVIQFNGEANQDTVTAYIDNLVSSTSPEPDPCDGVTGAPAIADDFDGNSVDILEYVGDNNVTYSVIDGTPTGVTSNVLEYVDGGGAGSDYANLQLRTCNKFDMAVTNFFTMDVYIVGSSLTGTQPNQVAFKLQDQSMGGNAWQSQVEVVVPVTAVDTWQTVEFDFIGSSDRIDFDQVVIQFNGEANQDTVTAYIDNLVSSTSPEPDPCDGVTGAPAIADDFDGNSVDILEYVGDNNVTYSVIDGTPTGVTSNVLEYVDGGGAGSDYANLQLRTCNKFDMAVTNFFTMDVYIVGSSLTGTQPNQVAFKLQDQSMGGNAWQSQVEVVVPVTAVDTWQTVEFDFIGSSDRIDFDQVVIQFNGEANQDTVTAYIDNLVSSTSPEPDPCDGVTGAPAIADDFDGNSVDILEYVGDNNVTYSVIDGTPTGVTSNVLEYVDGGGAGSDYANLQLRTCNKFDMAVTNFFTMDVYIVGSSLTGTQPNQVAFKLQDQSMGGNAWQSQVEVVVPVTAVDTWQTVEFDFIGSSDRIDFDQVVIQFNGEANQDTVTAYIDNLVSSTSPEPDPCDGVTGAPAIADDFDGNSVDILEYVGDNNVTYSVIDGTPTGVTSNVLEYVDGGGAGSDYANLQLRTCNKFDMAVTNFFTMDVYIVGSSLTGTQPNQVAFKLQDQSMGGNAWQSQVEVVVPVTAVDTWQTVEFDFIGSSDRIDFDQVVIQFNGEANQDTVTAYIDNLVSSTSVADTTPPVIVLEGANPQELTVGDAYVELGATATDDTDDDTTLTAAIVIDATAVDTATAGSYSVTYNVSDAAGNAATEVTRTVTVEAATVSGPPCTHTLVMNDQYNDTWDGASVDILVNGTVVASTTGPANGVADDTLTFDAASGDTIALGNWSSGSYDSEISWELLDGEGSSLGSGGFGDGTAGLTAYCTPPPPCPHTLVMNDQYNDTWDGASVDILVNGTVVASTTGPANGVADDTLAFDAASGDTIALGNWSSGSYDSEISWAILDGAGTEIAAGGFGDGTTEVTGYCPSCLDPTDLAVSDVTTTTASVTWTANNGETAWEYQVVESGATPAETGTATSDNLLALTGLTANTAYDVYVRANCGDGVTSAWVMVSFTTECDAVTAFPYTEDFDSDWSCWSVVNGDGDSYTWSQSATYITPRSGSFTAHGMGSNNDYLISPKFTLTGNERVVWYDIVESTTRNNTYDVLLSTTGKEISDFTVNLGTYDCTNVTWTEHILDLSAYSGDVYIALHQTYSASTFYGFGVDDFTIMENPSCIDPTDLTVADITQTTASVTWTANNGETAWEYQVVAGGATPDATGTATSDNQLALTDLTDNTTYDVYVRANCDADGTSEWVTVSFTTLPAPIVPDYTNDFTIFPGDLWTTDTGVLNTFGGWTADGFANNGTTGAAKLIFIHLLLLVQKLMTL